MSNQFKKVTRISYVENIKKSFVCTILGLILFFSSFALLSWNEGNRISLSQKEDIIDENTIILSSTIADRKNDNALIMISGSVHTDETLSDALISVNNALKLNRNVEMYQWIEHEKTKNIENIGGSTTKITTYSYTKEWSDRKHNSDFFHQKEYQNPKFTIQSEYLTSKKATMGDFIINEHQISKMNNYTHLDTLKYNPNYNIVDKYYYTGKNASNPEIGDIRISYTYIPSGATISIIGQQNPDNTITESKNKNIYVQYDGTYSFDEMLKKYKTSNQFMTFVFRFAGWMMMYTGLLLLIKPIETVTKIIPLLANVTNFISAFVLFIFSLALSLITIAIAWISYRPSIALTLLSLIFVLCYYFKNNLNKKQL